MNDLTDSNHIPDEFSHAHALREKLIEGKKEMRKRLAALVSPRRSRFWKNFATAIGRLPRAGFGRRTKIAKRRQCEDKVGTVAEVSNYYD